MIFSHKLLLQGIALTATSLLMHDAFAHGYLVNSRAHMCGAMLPVSKHPDWPAPPCQRPCLGVIRQQLTQQSWAR